ncbi:MAG: 50S ribosomal protein L4 [Nitrospiraceae bacterium]|nr:50S ribosomal protein L4 [Nitrospiraceae bacterium]
MEIQIKDTDNKSKGKIELSESIFNSQASEAVVHSAVRSFLANQRQGTHATKTRGLVSGGGKKPWKQKHTGRARHGSTRSPLWRGGGIVFGPQPRDYTIKLPKNVKRAALYKALTMKLNDSEITVVNKLNLEAPKTKDMIKILGNLGMEGKSVLIVLQDRDDNVILSSRNIPAVDVIRVADLNAYHIAAYDNLVFTQDALNTLQEKEAASK